jgi:hypothetical protein
MGLSLFFFVFTIGIIFGKAFGHLGVSMQCLDRAQHAENVEIRFFFGLAACSSSPLHMFVCWSAGFSARSSDFILFLFSYFCLCYVNFLSHLLRLHQQSAASNL